MLILFCTAFTISAKTIILKHTRDTTIVSNKGVDYMVTKDKNNLYLNISTSDHRKIMSILHSGITVYFDIKGKKKKNVFVKYPIAPLKPKRKREGNFRAESNPFEDVNKQDERIVKFIQDNLPQEAEYEYFDSNLKFNILFNRLDITALLNYNIERKVFNYELKIPKYKINSDPKKDLSKLTIGVKTNSMKPKEDGVEKPSVNVGGRGSGRQGGPPGGGQGGSQGRGQGGERKGPPNSDKNSNSTKNALNFWFKVNFENE